MTKTSQASSTKNDKLSTRRTITKEIKKTKMPEMPEMPDYSEIFKCVEISPTRYMDPCTLELMGILKDVETVLGDMGLAAFINMRHPTYEIPTREFLATVEIGYKLKKLFKAEHGYIKFTVGGKNHEVSFPTLCSLFGFHGVNAVSKNDIKFSTPEETSEFWDMIASGKFKSGTSKAAMIRSPVLRYVHKVLANTLYSRQDTSAVKNGEYWLLMEGVSGFLRGRDGSCLQSDSSTNLGAVFAKVLVDYKKLARDYWNSTKKIGPPVIRIGGLITHILTYCNVDLDGYTPMKGNPMIDGPYLAGCHFLSGISKNGLLLYQFKMKEKKVQVELPNMELTSIASQENVLFSVPVEKQYSQECLSITEGQWPDFVTKDIEAELEEVVTSPPEDEISGAPHGFALPLLDVPLRRAIDKWFYKVAEKQQEQHEQLREQLAQQIEQHAQLREQLAQQGEQLAQQGEQLAQLQLREQLAQQQRRKSL